MISAPGRVGVGVRDDQRRRRVLSSAASSSSTWRGGVPVLERHRVEGHDEPRPGRGQSSRCASASRAACSSLGRIRSSPGAPTCGCATAPRPLRDAARVRLGGGEVQVRELGDRVADLVVDRALGDLAAVDVRDRQRERAAPPRPPPASRSGRRARRAGRAGGARRPRAKPSTPAAVEAAIAAGRIVRLEHVDRARRSATPSASIARRPSDRSAARDAPRRRRGGAQVGRDPDARGGRGPGDRSPSGSPSRRRWRGDGLNASPAPPTRAPRRRRRRGARRRPSARARSAGEMPVPGRLIATASATSRSPARSARAATRLLRATRAVSASDGVGRFTPSPSAASTVRIAAHERGQLGAGRARRGGRDRAASCRA